MNLLRRLQRYQVALYPQELKKACAAGAVSELGSGSGIWCCNERFYTPDRGLVMESDEPMIA